MKIKFQTENSYSGATTLRGSNNFGLIFETNASNNRL
jgi:hypothetical protein